jgi:hypothetical protein
MNRLHVNEERSSAFLESVAPLLQDLPCRAEMVRFVEWHNLAFATALDLGLEEYVLHYDWYETRFNETLVELLDFLELQQVAPPEPFTSGKVYDYFSPEAQLTSFNGSKHAISTPASTARPVSTM